MDEKNITYFLQSLRGVQPMIVLCYLIAQRAMTIEELGNFTGLSDDAIRPAVKSLASKQLLFKQTGEHGKATWLHKFDTLFGSSAQNPLLADSAALIVVNVESEESQLNKLTTLTNRHQNPLLADSGSSVLKVRTIVKDEEDIATCLTMLNKSGIYGKKADEIAEDWHITVEDIRAHLAWVKTEEWANSAGMVIYRLLNHVIPPPLQVNGHIVDCKCRECRIAKQQKRYTESTFGELKDRIDESEEE